MAPPVHNQVGEPGDLSRAVAHLEQKQEEMRQDLTDVKEGVADIQRLLKGDTEAPEKSLLWRIAKLEEAEKKRGKVLTWVLAGAFTTIGATFAGWMLLGAKHHDSKMEATSK